MEDSTNEISKIEPIYNQYIRNLESIEIFFNKLSHKALEEDESILIAQKKYFEDSLRSTLGDEVCERFKAKLESEENGIIEITDESQNEDTYKSIEPEEINVEIIDEKESDNIAKEKLDAFYYKIFQAPKIQTKNFEILSNSTFLMLNNYFEYLFADLLSFHFANNKNIIEEKNISISLSELKNFSTIEEAYKDLLFKEIEKLLLDLNFEELKDYFKKLGVSLAEDFINWDLINEIRERRHLIVHNNAIINQKYLNKSKNIFNLNFGDNVNIENDYLKNAIDEVLFAGALLIFNCWGKWDKVYSSDAISEIVDLTFELLKRKNYSLVNRTCEYVEKMIKPRNEEEETYLLNINFNHCIALKRISKKKELNLKLENIRVGNLSPIYKLAKSVLIEDSEGVKNVFNQAIIVDDLIIDQYFEWPLFEDLRNNEELHKFCISQFETN